MKKFLTIFLLAAITLSFACEGGKKGLTPGDNIRTDIVPDCTIPANVTNPECVKQCQTDPTLSWCEALKKEKFSCPTDGSFKAVNPFSGAEIASVEKAQVADAGNLEYVFSAKPFVHEGLETLIAGRGKKLFIDAVAGSPSVDAGSMVIDVGAFAIDGKLYAVAATEKDITVVPFSKGPEDQVPVIDTNGIKTIDIIGGAKEVLIGSSVDLSGSGYITSAPSGTDISINVPVSGQTVQPVAGGSIDFAYFVSGAGDVWRIKLNHLVGGGCAERVYSADEHPDRNNNPLTTRRIAMAGQYLAVLAATSDMKLPAVQNYADQAWVSYEDKLIDQNKAHKFVTNDFYWLFNHLTDVKGSEQKILVIDLLATSGGLFKEVKKEIDMIYRYYATDLLLRGNVLFFTGYKYSLSSDLLKNADDLHIFNVLYGIWEAARNGTAVTDQATLAFMEDSGPAIFKANVDIPALTTSHQMLPKPAGMQAGVPLSIFTRLANDGDTIYMRGENRYFAKADAGNISGTKATKINIADPLTPWQTVFGNGQNPSLISTFIIDIYEIIDASDIQ